MPEQLTDILNVTTTVTGAAASILELGVSQHTRDVREQVTTKFGKEFPSATTFQVSLVAAGETPEHYTGEGSSYDTAVAQATNNGERQYDTDAVELTIADKVSVPFVLANVQARGKNRPGLVSALEREERILKKRFGDRLQTAPNAVNFKVAYFGDRWANKSSYDPQGALLAEGDSAMSLSEAEEKASGALGSKTHRAAYFQGTHQYKIVGLTREEFDAVVAQPAQTKKTVGRIAAATASAGGVAAAVLLVERIMPVLAPAGTGSALTPGYSAPETYLV